MAKRKTKEDVMEERSKKEQAEVKDREAGMKKVRAARTARKDALAEANEEAREREINLAIDEDEADKKPKPHMLDGKPGSGAGLKPGDWFAPKGNPGAAARVPTQPLQPESLQSHGKGIIHDKDLDNPPYGDDDPEEVDAGPSGSRPSAVDKDAEVEKAEKATSRFKQRDPDNPTVGAGGRKDATASPNPIGSQGRSKNRVAGGSNSGEGV